MIQTIAFFCLSLAAETYGCTLSQIEAKSNACTDLKVDIYQNVVPKTWLESTQASLAFVGALNPYVNIVAQSVNALLLVLDAQKESNQNLNAALEAKLNEALKRVGACITDKIEANDAEEARKALVTSAERFKELGSLVNKIDHPQKFMTAVDAVRTHVWDHFKIPSTNALATYKHYLPLYRATIMLYSEYILSYLNALNLDCKTMKTTTAAEETLKQTYCLRFDEYLNYLKKDVQFLRTWLLAAYTAIRTQLTPTNTPPTPQIIVISPGAQVSSTQCTYTQKQYKSEYNYPSYAYSYYGLSSINYAGVMPGSVDSVDMTADVINGQLSMVTPSYTFSCPFTGVQCKTFTKKEPWGSSPNYANMKEYPDSECCKEMGTKAVNMFGAVNGEITEWRAQFVSKYDKPTTDLYTIAGSIPSFGNGLQIVLQKLVAFE